MPRESYPVHTIGELRDILEQLGEEWSRIPINLVYDSGYASEGMAGIVLIDMDARDCTIHTWSAWKDTPYAP